HHGSSRRRPGPITTCLSTYAVRRNASLQMTLTGVMGPGLRRDDDGNIHGAKQKRRFATAKRRFKFQT
ncbi:MAG: hypothetical protein JZU55_12290, partial [Afipia sp.]|nr:hypothetical protein [Afipia sp.]